MGCRPSCSVRTPFHQKAFDSIAAHSPFVVDEREEENCFIDCLKRKGWIEWNEIDGEVNWAENL